MHKKKKTKASTHTQYFQEVKPQPQPKINVDNFFKLSIPLVS